MSFKTMALLHFTAFPMCAIAGLSDMLAGRVTWLTTFNLVLAALNLWLGLQRLEGK